VTDVTLLLTQAAEGEAGAETALIEAVYAELRHLARREFRKESQSHTLQTTALVSEAYLRLFRGQPLAYASRQHFFNVAARTMRRILVDHARASQAVKRPSHGQRVELEEQEAMRTEPERVLAVHVALEKLQAIDPRAAQIVELRFFAGMNVEETAEAIGISETSVKREFAAARAFLERAIGGDDS